MSSVMVAQVPDKWQSRGMGGGGAVYAPGISPFNPDEAWLSCDMSVISRTYDFGITWRTHSPATANGARKGTVFKTTDGGNTFSNVFLITIPKKHLINN